MAHPRLQAASQRKALTVGITAALLAVPMAGTGAATQLQTDVLEQEALQDGTGVLAAVDGALAGAEGATSEVVQPVEETVKSITETTAPVTEPVEKVVEKVVESATGPTTPPPTGGDDPTPRTPVTPGPAPTDDKVDSAGGSPQPVAEPSTSTRSADRPAGVRAAGGQDGAAPVTAETASPGLRHEFTHSGLRSANGGLTLQPFQAPIVANPFAFQAPEVADDVLTTTPGPSVAEAFETSATDLPRQLTEEGLPGAVTATAAGLLLLVGAGHLLHRSGRLRVAVVR